MGKSTLTRTRTNKGRNNVFASNLPGAYIFLVCNRVTRQPCWMTIQYNYFLRNLHENRVKFREARNAFVLVIQHGCRDVMCKPANQQYDANRPLPSSKNPLFQNEAKCTTFLVKISFICMRMKNHFYIKG